MNEPTTLPPSPAAKSAVPPAVEAAAAPTDAPLPHVSPGAIGWLRKLGAGSKLALSGALSRRRSVDSVVVGCLLTLLVISFDSAGWLSQIEFPLYDLRAKAFQFFLPRPTDKLVHLDLDEGVLDAVAASENTGWPWPRDLLAEMVDEVALAKPKVLGLDITFPEPQPIELRPEQPPATQPAHGQPYAGPSRYVDRDAIFGESLKRLGVALIPVSLPFRPRAQPSDLQLALRAELARDLNAPQAVLVERLRARGVNPPDLAEQVTREYLAAWRVEMSGAIEREVRAAPIARELVKQRLLKLDHSDLVLEGTFDELYDRALSASRIMQFSRPIPPGLPALFNTELELLPIPPIAAAARYSANVEYAPFPDGKVRAVPLFARHGDRMYPQMGLAMACAQLDVELQNLRFGGDSTVIVPTRDGREIVVPYRAYRSAALGEIPTFIDIPWWGGSDWASMYDHPQHRVPVNHLSLVVLLDLVLTRRKIMINAESADAAMIYLLATVDQRAAERYAAGIPPKDDIAARQPVYEQAIRAGRDTADLLHGLKADELDDDGRRFIAAYDSLPKLMAEFAPLQQRLRDGRADMAKRLGGKAVFVGWTATGADADFVPTSIHAKCPGVVLHGAIFNAIMTGELWRTLPQWVTFAITGFLGLCMTAAAAFLTPARALVVAFCLMLGYVLLNGILLFDYGNVILGAAGPLLCIAGVWQGCTLIRLIVERYHRSRIEGRFRSYVDPALVDYVVENPDQVKLEGQVREMTVCFTDLGNFTPLTEKLKEATVPLLNRIFGAMVPAIRNNGGYVNKFLGDGVMFFFGAPRENADHARDAMRTVLDIQAAMRAINAELSARGLPNITLRAGVNTGNMVVGDAGSEQASDYTVLGDDVNLAARMESANKQLGTTTLVAARTVELAGDDGLLLRPVGQICVVGRTQPVTAFEILATQADATERQRRLVELSRYMVDSFRDARLADCLRAAADLDREFGPSKLTKLYRDRCEHYQRQPDLKDFTCAITLAEK